MKYQGGRLAKRSRFGGVARLAAQSALSMVPYGRSALAAYRGAKAVASMFKGRRGSSASSKKKTDFQASAPVETGYASGHSAFTSYNKSRKLSKRAFKRKARFETKVRSAVQGSTKFQQYFQNCILGEKLNADLMSWFEIPIMTGADYLPPGTSTNANDNYFRVNSDEGDYIPASDITVNMANTRSVSGGAAGTFTATSQNNVLFASAKFLVYGYVLEYNIQNPLSIPITVEIFEVDCIKDFCPKYSVSGNSGVFPPGTGSSFCGASNVNSLSILANASAANATRQSAVSASGTQIAISYLAVGCTPFLFSDVGKYFRVSRSHVHVLDPSQIMRLQKKYVFRKPIAVQDMNQCAFKKGVSHVLCGTVRSTAIGTGNYAGPLPSVAVGAGGFTHSYVVNYNKRFIVKPLDLGNVGLGVRNQVL